MKYEWGKNLTSLRNFFEDSEDQWTERKFCGPSWGISQKRILKCERDICRYNSNVAFKQFFQFKYGRFGNETLSQIQQSSAKYRRDIALAKRDR